MNCINQVVLEGTVEERELVQNGMKLTVSYVRTYKGSDGNSAMEKYLIDVECWGAMAEMIERYGNKGRGLRIVGRLKQKNGSVKIVAEHVEFKPIVIIDGEHPSATGLDKGGKK